MLPGPYLYSPVWLSSCENVTCSFSVLTCLTLLLWECYLLPLYSPVWLSSCENVTCSLSVLTCLTLLLWECYLLLICTHLYDSLPVRMLPAPYLYSPVWLSFCENVTCSLSVLTCMTLFLWKRNSPISPTVLLSQSCVLMFSWAGPVFILLHSFLNCRRSTVNISIWGLLYKHKEVIIWSCFMLWPGTNHHPSLLLSHNHVIFVLSVTVDKYKPKV